MVMVSLANQTCIEPMGLGHYMECDTGTNTERIPHVCDKNFFANKFSIIFFWKTVSFLLGELAKLFLSNHPTLLRSMLFIKTGRISWFDNSHY